MWCELYLNKAVIKRERDGESGAVGGGGTSASKQDQGLRTPRLGALPLRQLVLVC